MGIHFYEESPSPPSEQKGRLTPCRSLVESGIPFVVWAEDALSIIHRVPTGLFDQQLLVREGDVSHVAQIISEKHNYSVLDLSSDKRWNDYKIYNPEHPSAFQGHPSILLGHNNMETVLKYELPDRILIHAASIYHVDIDDVSRTCLNPNPPGPEFASIRFPTLPAFHDSLIDTLHEPPLPFIHIRFQDLIKVFLSYLKLYTLSKEGITTEETPPERLGVTPQCLEALDAVKDENKPHLARLFLRIPDFGDPVNALERKLIKEARW
ncbi:hypothetical protein ONZ45_g12038 [Pleurotus djamor]|nr:hypothetical protein ONZ45_g12038 [Pleurotus djamor]